MQGTNDLIKAIKAGYSYFYIDTKEINRTLVEIKEALQKYINGGAKLVNQIKVWDYEQEPDPEKVMELLNTEGTIVIAKNFNWFLKDEYGQPNKQIISYLQSRSDLFTTADQRAVLIILGDPTIEEAVPSIIRKDFMHIAFPLPGEKEIGDVLNFIIESVKGNKKFKAPTKDQKTLLIQAAKGLGKREIGNAFSYSLVANEGQLDPATVAEIKAKEVENTAGLKIVKNDLDFSTLKGYTKLKDFAKRSIKSPLSKGIILLGPPGTGKTHFARCLANESGRIMFEAEFASLFGSLVGESEGLMKSLLEVVKANAPCILFVDEIEKGLAGVSGGGQTGDGGTTKRSMSQFLKFMSNADEREGVYVIATCNDISALPPEWVRAERWDSAPFFINLPNSEEQEDILKYYQKKYAVKGKAPDMKGWSGAEIQSCCRLAKMMETDLEESQQYIIPIAKTMKEEIQKLMLWKEDRTLEASQLKDVSGKKRVKAIDLN